MHKQYAGLALLWTILIVMASLINLEGAPKIHISNLDKAVHALMYFTFTILWILGLGKKKVHYIVITAILLGGLLEIAQGLTHQHRSADWFDFLANSLGVLLALLLINKIILLLKHFRLYN